MIHEYVSLIHWNIQKCINLFTHFFVNPLIRSSTHLWKQISDRIYFILKGIEYLIFKLKNHHICRFWIHLFKLNKIQAAQIRIVKCLSPKLEAKNFLAQKCDLFDPKKSKPKISKPKNVEAKNVEAKQISE